MVTETTPHNHPATVLTRQELRTVAHSQLVRELSSLSLPEVEGLVERIACNTPTGNVPSMILNGLLRAGKASPQTAQRDMNLLLRAMHNVKDKAVFAFFFAGPAIALHSYQAILQLAGKDPDSAFPNGTWQFYVDYALRDDLARHANETDGFDTTLRQHHLTLAPVDRLTAWVMAAVYTLHQYDDLLANEWRERTHTRLLRELTRNLPEAKRFANVYRLWEKVRPYGRGADVAPADNYPSYRRQKFDAFMAQTIAALPPALQQTWRTQTEQAEQEQLASYQKQLGILAYLEPETYVEQHLPLDKKEVHVGLIYRDQYYFIPICQPNSTLPAYIQTVRGQIAAILAHPIDQPPATLTPLAEVRRTAVPALKKTLPEDIQKGLSNLCAAPILLNADPQPPHLPLAQIRRAERGMGDHALTIFDTGQSFVFDQSHIFFDGAWGAALAEMMTNEALAWATYLHTLPTAVPSKTRPFAPLLHLETKHLKNLESVPKVTAEASAESAEIEYKNILRLRQFFKQRSGLLQLTVNDLLVLYRAIHAARYQPSPSLQAELAALQKVRESRSAATAALEAMRESGRQNPATLIPVDASQRSPRDRLYPMTFEVPLAELDLLNLHAQTMAALDGGSKEQFNELRRTYLHMLASFGELFSRAKAVGIEGKSDSVTTMKLLANLHPALQKLLNTIPDRFDILNDLLKGREVFSNVGVVVPSSSLRRFITAKDDNEKKTLCWGVLTDADGVMRMSLRDFRPHVALLHQQNQAALAQRITQDYLDSYVHGLNSYVRDVKRIAGNQP
ncbi:MAG: hypothetical protein OT477_10075 [Chloroflexi bacterium]|nr:hypothetical protein [Chloroflexota bacterium]